MGVASLTSAAPAVFGQRLTEGYLTQPNLMGAASLDPRGRVRLLGTVNLEGYTLRRGELNAGMYGEGYVDRRHPHTLVHEVMASVRTPAARGFAASLAAGKGFTPFGTDDPMMRPFTKYPVNHHHAQIIERVQTVGAVAWRRASRGVVLEHGLFNGDEPVGPFAGPEWSRVGDSHSTRLTVLPRAGLEWQLSRAFVRSPGIVQGGAFDHRQWSSSVRWGAPVTGAPNGGTASHASGHAPASHGSTGRAPVIRYALLEVARTDEGFGAARVFRFESVLAETQVAWRGWALAGRQERTERPENERLLDPFRTANGHIDFQIIGVTRWSISSLQLMAPAWAPPVFGRRAARVMPYLEVARAHAVARRQPAVFVPAEFYGNATQWSVTVGTRLHVGTMRHRMGRYGVLDPTTE
jgi:hypothetical protein